MSTWFAQYVSTSIQAKFQAAQPWLSIINVGTADNVEEIVNMFAADPDVQTLTIIQQWPGEAAATEHIVYRHVMYVGGSAV
jgi:hypothetical protein